MRNIAFGLLIIIIIHSCNEKGRWANKNKSILNYSLDSFYIDLTARELPTYFHFSNIKNETSGSNIFIGYNNFEHSFDFFDLKKKILIKKVFLDSNGPNAISSPSEFIFIDNNTILIRGVPFYYKVDTLGKVIERRRMNDLSKGKNFVFINFMELGYPENSIAYGNERIYSYILPLKDNFWEKKFYQQPIFVAINLEKNLTDFIPVYYPSQAANGKLFGYKLKPYILFLDNCLLYNFPFSSRIYKYHLSNKKLEEFDIISNYTDNESESLSFSKFKGNYESLEVDKHFLYSLHFHKIVYDPYKNLFYRIHSLPIENDPKNRSSNYMCIFNTNFEKIGEIKLPEKNLFINNYFPTERGIVFQISNFNNFKDINKLKFITLQIKL